MSSEKKSDTTEETIPPTNTAIPSTVEPFNETVQNAEYDKGYRGVPVDPTPNENYTVAGVLAGKPTPETSLKAAKAASKATGLGVSALEAREKEKLLERGKK